MTKKKKATFKQKKFVEKYLEHGNGTRAALEVYNTDDENSASSIATENLQKLEVQELFKLFSKPASIRTYELMKQDDNLAVALGAAKDIQDRAGYKPPDKKDINVTGGLTLTALYDEADAGASDVTPEVTEISDSVH